ncbi:hypothetical protein ALQ36_101309 [Pseudomonas syringae pv. primulae]|uniref:Uncharacterized protein n=1 Tax=Pseudomonas syringae pv. primulae TaxID=251707 RepID=A0A3M3XVG9_9PSED|nr:hypothetical protein ALQ36_101309 [Pseudomonas syringae pv. primulae]RMU40040.1 hypothetical protein ALP30_101412 [Pseudomonas syringae pv. primulae]
MAWLGSPAICWCAQPLTHTATSKQKGKAHELFKLTFHVWRWLDLAI